MVINCPGGRLIYHKDADLTTALAHRISYARSRNWGGSWMNNSDQLSDTNVYQVANLREIVNDFRDTVKIRIEEPHLQIYAEDEDTMKEIAARILSEFQSSIQLIQIPFSDEHIALLKEGKILTKSSSKIDYRYKIMLRDGNYGAETKQQVLNYINNLDKTDIKVSQGTLHNLSTTHGFLWGSFLYVNDTKILTFLNMICPGIVLNIHELTKIEE
jgi:hypothetical protein